jgi:hypothetical protein
MVYACVLRAWLWWWWGVERVISASSKAFHFASPCGQGLTNDLCTRGLAGEYRATARVFATRWAQDGMTQWRTPALPAPSWRAQCALPSPPLRLPIAHRAARSHGPAGPGQAARSQLRFPEAGRLPPLRFQCGQLSGSAQDYRGLDPSRQRIATSHPRRYMTLLVKPASYFAATHSSHYSGEVHNASPPPPLSLT